MKLALYVTAAPGEYEPASFAIKAFSDLSAMTVTVGNLVRSGGGTIASSNVDVSVVKCWYQNGTDSFGYVAGKKVLVPELLLKDDSLIYVNTGTLDNYVNLNGVNTWISDPTKRTSAYCPANSVFPVTDSSVLLPVNIASNKLKQFWLTINVPAGTAGGEYTGDITFTTPSDGTIGNYKITVNVLPFSLENTPLKYSMYYCGVLTTAGTGTISAINKSTGQFSNEMINMVKHGVNNPTVYQDYSSLPLLSNALTLRTNAAINGTALYYLGLITGNSTDTSSLAALKTKVTNVRNVAANYGITDVYIYGMDEATSDNLLKQREAWEAVHEAGGKVFVSGYSGSLALQYPYGKCGSWHFDEGAGTIANDSSEKCNDGKLVNMSAATCRVGGKIAGALAFDGTDDYVDCGNGASLNPGTSDFTYEFWAKSSQANGWVEILNKANGQFSTLTAGWNLTVRHDLANKPIIYTHTQYAGGYTVYWYNNAGSYFQDNIWHHWVLVGRRTAGTVELFKDGASLGMQSPANFTSQDITTAANLNIGGKGGARSFNGTIDEVRIYNRALRTDEIYKNYQDGINGKWTTVGDLKDLHVNAFELSTADSDKSHEVAGHKIFSYANPMVGAENPEIYRRNYGLLLWKYGYDGVMNYAYHVSCGFIWNDFDHSTYRDFNFTYPTTNGVIDTIAWEGFREGVDDTRYMTTLEKAITEAPESAAKNDAIAFVNSLKETDRLQFDDLTDIRNEIISHILNLIQ